MDFSDSTKTCSACGIIKPSSEFRIARNGTRIYQCGKCKQCEAEYSRQRHTQHPEIRASYYAKNAERQREAVRQANRKRKQADPDGVKARTLQSVLKWQKSNPHAVAEKSAKRKAAKLQATPLWYDKDKARAVYALAQFMSQHTGIKWNVDHIVPLQSPHVCGLHVHTNMTFTPAAWNQSKGNRHWPDMS